MRSPNQRFGLIGCLTLCTAVAVGAIVAATSTSNAQFRPSSVSVGPRAPMISPSFRSEPRFQRFNNNAPNNLGTSNGKGKGRVSTNNPDGRDGRPPRHRPPRGKHPPGLGPVGIGTGVAIATPGPAGAGSRPPSGGAAARIDIPPPGENRFVKNEVVLEFPGNVSAQQASAVARRNRLTRIESAYMPLTNSTFFRWRITDGRPVRGVLNALRREGVSAQPNYLFLTSQQQDGAAAGFAPRQDAPPKPTPAVATAATRPSAGDPAQYVLGKLRINEAHNLATGDKVLVAVIDSGIDLGHPELKGVVAGSFDALGTSEKPHMHGTAIAGAIAAHARLMGAAPAARILAIRAFGATGNSAEATTFAILKGIQYAVQQNARIINMSFAGPRDPGLGRALAAAKARGAVLIAASGNFGPKSPPQYPAADPNVIAVSATDAEDHMFRASNIGTHIAVSAPGVDVLLPVPDNNYEMISGTSFSAAYVSGIAALVIQRAPALTPDAVRHILESTAKDLGPRGKDPQYGAGLVDAYGAIMAVQANASAEAQKEVSERVKPQ
jgi:subtilisin family serine protease